MGVKPGSSKRKLLLALGGVFIAVKLWIDIREGLGSNRGGIAVYSQFFSVPSGKYRHYTSIRPRTVPFKSSVINQSPVCESAL